MAELINIENSSGDEVSQMASGSEPPVADQHETKPEPVIDSPKPLAFTIDFGERKSVDTNRFKNIFEKYQNRHRRNQSMSKVPSVKEKVPVQKPPSSAHFPRKATTDYHSEGYFSSDQDDKTETSFLRQLKMLGLKSNVINATMKQPGKSELTLPLQNTTAQKMDKFSPLNNFGRMPHEDLNDISSPEFDVNTPAETPGSATKSVQFTSKKLSSFDESTESVSPKLPNRSSENRILNNLSQNAEELIIIEPNEQYQSEDCGKDSYEIEDLDDQLSDSVSETGTYTIDADNYTEEQKARMSIDREIVTSVPALSPAQRTHNFVESTLQYVSNPCKYAEEPPIEQYVKPPCKYIEEPVCKNNSIENNIGATSFIIEDNGLLKQKILSPQDSLTQISIESNNETLKQTNLVKKILNIDSPVVRRSKNTNTVIFASSKPPEVEEQYEIDTTGSFTSITTCGVFNRDEKMRQAKEISPKRRGSLTQSDIFVENINKVAPTKIPSPIHSLSRPRSRASLELPDDTDLYLKQTQNVISNLQARLTSETESKIAQNFLKTKHVRHNSFDLTKNTTHVLNNKLENFQTKVFHHSNIEPTKQVAIATRSPTHKLYNSPNNSPIKRSSSFSSKQISSYTNTNAASDVIYINTGAAPIVSAQRNSIRMSPNVDKKTAVHRSMSTASIKNHLAPIHRLIANSDIYQQNHNRSESYGGISAYNKQESESSSEDDGACYIDSCSSGNEAFSTKKEQNNITNTRHNRAFSLRRARLDLENNSTNKCPNTPEMRRKFPIPEPTKNPRSTSTDARKPTTTSTDVKSRYMNIAPKSQQSPKISSNRDPTPVGRSILNNRPSSASTPSTQKAINVSPSAKSASISRTDSGRFSMRATAKTKPVVSTTKSSGKKGNRSNSTLTSREVEFQMWKRRKSYDPMKAAAEGKKKAEMNKKMQNNVNMMTQSYTQASQDYDSSPSHSSSVHRSQSFHGTGGLDNYISSDEDLTLSADDGEGITPPAPTPNIRSPERSHPRVKQAWCVKNTRY